MATETGAFEQGAVEPHSVTARKVDFRVFFDRSRDGPALGSGTGRV